jgi:TRAP-type C4-dicarboxylate transport system substrate-binding protein
VLEHTKDIHFLSLFTFSTKGVAAPCATPTHIIKFATIAPEGSGVFKGIAAIKQAIKTKTEGCVDLQIYAGGVSGDEKDVVRKMGIGQLDGAGLTGVGLGQILSEIRVLELPFLFKDQAQIDSVYAQMKSYFEQKFLEKNYHLLGWAEVGLVEIFCRDKGITTAADLKGRKMWMWEGDPLAQSMYQSLDVVPVPLAIPDVLTSLQTGLIDCAYSSALGAIAFQWHTKTKFVTQVDLVNATGGIVLTKAAWAKLAPDKQAIVKQVIAEESKKLTTQARLDNQQSMDVLKQAGLTVQVLTPEVKTELTAKLKPVRTNLVDKLYPQALLDKVEGLTQ